MDLRTYLNSLPVENQRAFAIQCGTTVGYLRKCLSHKSNIGARICVEIEKHSGRAVLCESMNREVDWQFIRGTSKTFE